jgi:hypothetical protein
MDDMRAAGVKRASFELEFRWRDVPTEIRVVRSLFFTEYDDPSSQITDPPELRHIAKGGLGKNLAELARAETLKSSWFFEHPHNDKGLRGIAYVELFDDEWLPGPHPLLQPLNTYALPLEQAASVGDKLTVSHLLETEKPGPDALQDALFAAIRGWGEKTDIIRFLGRAGARFDILSSNGETPLTYSARYDKPLTTRLLISLGANVNAKNYRHESALAIAKRNEYTDVVDVLKAAGALD